LAKPGKRGPAPKLQQQLERVQSLPKAQQQAISKVLDSVLAAHQNRAPQPQQQQQDLQCGPWA
jgi:hypothetical protein